LIYSYKSTSIPLFVTHEYLQIEEHNDSTLLYLIDVLDQLSVSTITELNQILQNITLQQPCTT